MVGPEYQDDITPIFGSCSAENHDALDKDFFQSNLDPASFTT